jgi:hypothetical protein
MITGILQGFGGIKNLNSLFIFVGLTIKIKGFKVFYFYTTKIDLLTC